jgi:hypothetical protein
LKVAKNGAFIFLGLTMGPVKAIRAKCLECGGSMKEVRLCPAETCPLYPYRMGRNPNRAGIGGGVANLKGRETKF